MKTFYSNIHPSRRSPMSIEKYAEAVSRKAGVAIMSATMDTIEESYMNAETVAEGAAALKALSSAEIGRRNRALMFGENDEAFPSDDEWSSIVD